MNSFLSSGSFSSAFDAGHARNGENAAYVLYLVTEAVTAAAFIPWFFVAYRNLERRGLGLRFSRGWAIGSWFIPFFNLVRPKQIANDLWRGSHARSGNLASLQDRPVSPLIHWWWALYLLGGVVFGIGHVVSDDVPSGDSLHQVLTLERTGFYIAILGALILIAALVVLAIGAYRITQAQDEGRVIEPQPQHVAAQAAPVSEPAETVTRPTPRPEPTPAAGPTGPRAGWYPDPAGSGRSRYWSGSEWTEHLH